MTTTTNTNNNNETLTINNTTNYTDCNNGNNKLKAPKGLVPHTNDKFI